MRKHWPLLLSFVLLIGVFPVVAQDDPRTTDFPIRNFGACINLPDFTRVTEPDEFNTVYDVPGLFSINFAEYLLPITSLPSTSDEIYTAMITLLNAANAGDYVRIDFVHSQYLSAAVEFTLNGRRMFGMIYRNQFDNLFFLFADKVDGFDMLAIGRAIFAADRRCNPLAPIPTRQNALAVADFDTCRAPNNLGGNMGVAYNSPDSSTEAYIRERDRGCIVRIQYNINAWAAFWLQLESVDLTSYNNLVFDIRADAPQPQQLKIELKRNCHEIASASGNTVTECTEIEITYITTISSTWRTITLPLPQRPNTLFRTVPWAVPLASLTALQELVFVVERDTAGAQGTFYLDNIHFSP